MHIHWPRVVAYSTTWAFYDCRCGARRTQARGNGYSAHLPGWPRESDGWQRDPVCTECRGTTASCQRSRIKCCPDCTHPRGLR